MIRRRLRRPGLAAAIPTLVRPPYWSDFSSQIEQCPWPSTDQVCPQRSQNQFAAAVAAYQAAQDRWLNIDVQNYAKQMSDLGLESIYFQVESAAMDELNAHGMFSQLAAQPSSSSSQPTTAPPPVQQPALIFQNLTTGNTGTVIVGDRWKVEITGGAPNAPVSVTGGRNGGTATTAMGQTDASGHFVLTGQAKPEEVGTWQETWYVGGQAVGSFGFSAVPQQTSTPVPPVTTPAPGSTETPSVNVNAWFENLKSVPWWAWVAGAGVLVMWRRS